MSGSEWVVVVVLVVGFAAVVGVLAAGSGLIGGRRAAVPVPVLASKLRTRVLVTLKTGEVFAGILFEADDRAWILRAADALNAADDGSNLPVDGEIIVLTTDIAYAQKP